jgi:TM2 domain-containing membrane protein YozV
MRYKGIVAGLLSVFVPGLGQMYAGKGERGAAILIASIIAGNLFVIWLNMYASMGNAPYAFWSHAVPRILHDIFSVWGIIFLAWQVVDAYKWGMAASPS